ncbi:putative 1,3-beta-glucan synthase [Helianthus debilis subsp. tardiflorus]
MHRRAAQVNFVEIRSYWHVFRSFDTMWSFFILCLQAMIIVAWNGDGNPTSIFESDVFKKVLSVFITALILKLGQAVLDVVLNWKVRQCMPFYAKLRYLLKEILGDCGCADIQTQDAVSNPFGSTFVYAASFHWLDGLRFWFFELCCILVCCCSETALQQPLEISAVAKAFCECGEGWSCVFCVGLWCLDENWYYSLFTLFMLFMFESTMAKIRLKTLSELRCVRVDNQMLMVYRCGKWTKIARTDLLPGDVLSVSRAAGQDGEEKSVPADMLILAGTAVVNKAILTGESTPQWKENSKRFDRGVTVRCQLVYRSCSCHNVFI